MLLLGQDKAVDRQGIYSQIQAIKANIHQDILPPTTFAKTEPLTAPENMQGLWAQLKSLVSLKRSDTPFEAPLNIQQYQLLEHSLRLMLEQAQWALLKADQTLYVASLSNAIDWIDSKLRHHKAVKLSDSIKQLKTQNIQMTLPDVSQSLRLLRQILSDRTHRPTEIKPVQNKTAPPKIAPAVKKQPEQV